MMKSPKIIIIVLFFLISIDSYGQSVIRKNYFPIFTFHRDSINIQGISVGLWSLNTEPRYTNTNGIKLELIGVGFALPLVSTSILMFKTRSNSAIIFIKI